MIKDLLKEKNCFIKESVKDWKDAICVACAPMIEQGYCMLFSKTQKNLGPIMCYVKTWL